MIRKSTRLIVFASLLFLISCNSKSTNNDASINLDAGWKFSAGDNPDFAKIEFDDSDWKTITVDITWEKQGHSDLDGFVWYRLNVIIPSSLKENAELKDSLIFNLGRIDDFDQFYFNGELIGENLKNIERGKSSKDTFIDTTYSPWNVPRRYSISADDELINWDNENLLAVRVFDWGGAGGIYSGDLNITMPKFKDYLAFNINKGVFEDNGGQFGKELSITNTSDKYDLTGEFEIKILSNINGEEIYSDETEIILSPGERKEFAFNFIKPVQSTNAKYCFTFEDSDNEAFTDEGVPYILTPPAKDEPQINGALIYGERTGKPFLYRIAATGKRPLVFSAEGLPEGLKLDMNRGIIFGAVHTAGVYKVLINAMNELASDSKTLELVIGDKIALTPPMGWNSWNCWGLSVDHDKVLSAAQAFVQYGLADHGWTYINIDDGWEIPGNSDSQKRSPRGVILTNQKFPDMKKLGDEIHSLGLKFGIYTTPGDLTCGGYTGTLGHEYQDAATFAEWGIDYVKYDLCGYRKLMTDLNNVEELMPPYQLMQKALKKVDRDIIYSLCEYGLGKVWEWGESVGGNLWRTTGDIWDDWDRLRQIGFSQVENAKYAGPGHWNDPDMLVLGWVGWGPNLHQTELTPDEQYTHVSLWALLSAPLLLGNDLTKLDDFTLNLITNDEVIAVDQDKLGKQAIPAVREETIEVWKKHLSDEAIAIGIFNVGIETQKYTLKLKDVDSAGKVKIRDLWTQKDEGIFEDKFETTIPAHGVKLIKIFPN